MDFQKAVNDYCSSQSVQKYLVPQYIYAKMKPRDIVKMIGSDYFIRLIPGVTGIKDAHYNHFFATGKFEEGTVGFIYTDEEYFVPIVYADVDSDIIFINRETKLTTKYDLPSQHKWLVRPAEDGKMKIRALQSVLNTKELKGYIDNEFKPLCGDQFLSR